MIIEMKKKLLRMPVMGPLFLKTWRLFKDPYLGPIGDQIARRLSGSGQRVVVQIGANDGERFDPVSALIKNRRRWRALFVEPIPSVFERLQKNFGISERYMYECSAIGTSRGSFNFYYLADRARQKATAWQEYFDLVGSLDRAHVVKALVDQAELLDDCIVETQVPVITVDDLLQKWKLNYVDLLVVDAEGYDWRIVQQAFANGLRPEVILFEHSNLTESEKDDVQKTLAEVYDVNDVGIDYLCFKKTPVQ